MCAHIGIYNLCIRTQVIVFKKNIRGDILSEPLSSKNILLFILRDENFLTRCRFLEVIFFSNVVGASPFSRFLVLQNLHMARILFLYKWHLSWLFIRCFFKSIKFKTQGKPRHLALFINFPSGFHQRQRNCPLFFSLLLILL